MALFWSDPGDASITDYQYRLRRPEHQETYGPWIDIPSSGASTTHYIIPELDVDTLYNVRLRACNVAGCGGSRVFFRILVPALPDLPPLWPGSGFWFSDDDGSVDEAAIEALAAAGVTRGCRPGFYCPAEDVTRGQFASLLARAFPHLAPDGANDRFGDDDGSVHEAAINALAAAGIADGCGPRSFCPADPIRRDHTATMLARALPGPGTTGPDYFDDDDGSVHEAAINALAAAGIADGCGPRLFCPADPIRRDHTATMLAQALGLDVVPIEPAPWKLELVAGNIYRPTDLQAPTGDDRAFVTTKQGEILIIADGAVSPEPFLDLTHKVRTRGEQGLLGLAFHPHYAANGKLYVFYTGLDGHSHLYQYQADPQNPNRADPATGRRIITIEQSSPNGWHLGGQLQFGPDGYLYIAVGDGESDLQAQNPRNLLGTIMRIDVDNGDPYAIPADNPYADGRAGQPEIWAYGLHNPWRFSFDGSHIYIADVGGVLLEEINIADASVGAINYGWPTLEGTHCHTPPPPNCDTAGLVTPQIEYPHSDGIAVIGGYVYRGDAIGEMTGHYFYSDYTGGWIRTFAYQNGQITQHRQTPQPDRVYSFGTDGHGELYLLTETAVHKIVPR